MRQSAQKFFAKSILSIILAVFLGSSSLGVFGENCGVPMPPEPSGEAAYVLELATGTVIYEKNADERMYPASITKIMSALLTAEYIESGEGRLEDKITFSYEAIYGIPRDTMHISIEVGEQLSVLQVLYAIMLPSANEACLGMAEYVAGTTDAFVGMMNEKAATLGLENTNFVTANGLHDPNHYTTAKDLAVIFEEVLKHELLLEIMSTVTYDIPPTNKMSTPRRLTNTNKLIVPGSGVYNPYVRCGKTGFTTPAGNTLIIYAEKDGLKIISVILKSAQGTIYSDMSALVNYVAENIKLVSVDNLIDFTVSLPTAGDGRLMAEPRSVFKVLAHTEDDYNRFEKRYTLPQIIDRPVAAGERLGMLELYDGDVRVGGVDLVAKSDYGLTTSETSTAPFETTQLQTQIQTQETAAERPFEEKRSDFIATVVKLVLILLLIAIFCALIYAGIIIASVIAYNRCKKNKNCSAEPIGQGVETDDADDIKHTEYTMRNILDEELIPDEDRTEEK